MDYQTKATLVDALGIAESIAMRLKDMATSVAGGKWTQSEYADVARTLGEIEARLYRKGEYSKKETAKCPS